MKDKYHKVLNRFLSVILLLSILLTQLRMDYFTVHSADNDYVKIIAISPNYYRSYTTEMTFTAIVEYNLESRDHGIVYLGFNTQEPHSYSLYASQEVEKGSGTVTLQATLTPVDWSSYWKAGYQLLGLLKGASSMETDFKVYANLSEYPHEDSWKPLATYEETLEYMNADPPQMEPLLYTDKNGHDDEDEFQDLKEGASPQFTEAQFHNSLEELCSETASTVYNPRLADMLMSLSCGAYYKQCTLENYDHLGFDRGDVKTYNYYLDWDDKRYGDDSVAYTIGKKQTWDGRTMILVTIRGSYADNDSISSKDWRSNFNLGEAETGISWHKGFDKAAKEVFKTLQELYGDTLPKDNTFYVLTGHSRGAGVANLVSVLISDNGVPKLNVYDYNFACPDVARNIGTGWNWLGDHDNIFNVANANDPVAWIPGVLGDMLGNASDTATDIYSLFNNPDVKIQGASGDGMSAPLTDWGKFGRSYWFSSDWDKVDSKGMDFSLHDQKKYVEYMHEHRGDPLGDGDMKTWEGVVTKSNIAKAAIGLSVLFTAIKGILLFFLCPVDVEITDSSGNIVASVVDGVPNYHESTLGDVVILNQGSEKLIFIKDGVDLSVKLTGSDSGTMTYAAVETDMLGSEAYDCKAYYDVELKKGKTFEDHVVLSPEDNKTISSELYVVDRNGNPTAKVMEDGQEISEKTGLSAWLAKINWLVVLLVALGIIVLAIIVILVKRTRSKAKKQDTVAAPTYGYGSDLSQTKPQNNTMGSGISVSGDIICPKCGYSNPIGIRTCMGCGKKLKRK